jgi:hypothetical protein
MNVQKGGCSRLFFAAVLIVTGCSGGPQPLVRSAGRPIIGQVAVFAGSGVQ